MKISSNKYVVMLAVVGIAIFAGHPINARKPEPDFIMDVNPVENEVFPGPNRLQLTFKSLVELGDVVLKVKTVGPIVYTGMTERNIQVHMDDSLSYPLEIKIPAHDTSGLEISIELKGHRITGTGIFFVSTKTPIEVRKDDPFRMAEIERSLEINTNPYKGKKLPYGPGHPAPPPKMTVYTPSDEEKMHEMEREPLTDADVQHIEVDGEIWTRNRGEYKFKKLEQLSHEQYYQVLMDKYGDSTSFRVIINLRDSADYRFVSQLTDNALQKTDSAGFFETTLTKRQLWEVFKRGIAYQNLGSAVSECKSHDSTNRERPVDGNDGSINKLDPDKSEALDTLWRYDFESLWQNSWLRYDDYPFAEEDYWDYCYQTYVPAHSGSQMVWCAGYGDMQCGTHYDVCMEAWMKTAAATYIGDHENVKLRFWVWYETEYQYDYLTAWYSFDTISWHTFYSPPYLTGSSGGWQLKELDIPPDHDSLYIGFEFWSDFDSTSQGAFIDDISLVGTANIPRPNLTSATPSGWDYPIVPSTDTGTNTVGPLLGNAPTYVDFAVKNAVA